MTATKLKTPPKVTRSAPAKQADVRSQRRLKAENEATFAVLHDRRIAYTEHLGAGPVYLLVHGIGGSQTDWTAVTTRLVASGQHVITVDLPGHGLSAKDRGDYSLGAMASVLRDLLDHLGHRQAILVGHSLGGGVAMQFTYQFPERCNGLILVCSGGLGTETPKWLRAATLPGSRLIFAAIGSDKTTNSLLWGCRQLARVGIEPQLVNPQMVEKLSEFGDPDAREAFLSTLRSVVDVSGQRVTALGKLSSMEDLPVLLIWGARDPVIPLHHGERAAEVIPNSELVVFPRIGHEPHVEDPDRFAQLLRDFQHRVVIADDSPTAAQS
ncbi:MAG TPA: alpha/beta hydrolase [Actinobacteria bacterium]|nr:alpha/beta hydrolase [Actinomycetota bacterium]